jgi:hypothetical protein
MLFEKITFMRNIYYLMRPIIIISFLALLAGGCVQREIIQSDFEAQRVLKSISGVIDENNLLSAMAQIDLVTPNGHHTARAAMIMKRPSYLRLEIFSPIGPPDFFLTASPDEMRILIPSRGEVYLGRPTSENLARFFSWQFDIEDIVMIFTGSYPSRRDRNVSYHSYPDGNALRIEIRTPSGNSQIIFVGNDDRMQKYVQNDEYGKEMYHAIYEDYRPQSSVAGKITINMADGVTSICIKYSDIKIEKVTDMSIFELPVPTGAKSIYLN